jgi:hypothetical protein
MTISNQVYQAIVRYYASLKSNYSLVSRLQELNLIEEDLELQATIWGLADHDLFLEDLPQNTEESTSVFQQKLEILRSIEKLPWFQVGSICMNESFLTPDILKIKLLKDIFLKDPFNLNPLRDLLDLAKEGTYLQKRYRLAFVNEVESYAKLNPNVGDYLLTKGNILYCRQEDKMFYLTEKSESNDSVFSRTSEGEKIQVCNLEEIQIPVISFVSR